MLTWTGLDTWENHAWAVSRAFKSFSMHGMTLANPCDG